MIHTYTATALSTEIGVIQTRFTQAELNPVWDEITQIQNNFDKAEPVNDALAGHIEKEYDLPKCRDHLQHLIMPFVNKHGQHFDYLKTIRILSKPLPYFLNSAWVNFQKKYEFNPIHNHTGVLSFVIWMKVPYEIKDERAVFPHAQGTKRTSCFEFVYSNATGGVTSQVVEVDKSYEGMMVLFPSSLNHCVNPFYTSDEYRISVSGNFVFEVL